MATKANGNMDDWVRTPPPQGNFCQRLGNVIYNPEEKSFLGRTPKRWGIMLTFYLVFYAVLALLFGLCMGGLFLSLEDNRPTYLLDQSLIGSSPGVTTRPLPDNTVMRIKTDNGSDYQQYIAQLDEFFQDYRSERWYTNYKNCTSDDNYGYPDTPCIFVKVNKIIGWEPSYIFVESDIPEDMPEDLAEYVRGQARRQVWVSCEAEKDNETKIEYPWGRGLPAVFYPFRNDPGYKSPIVAVKLTPPRNRLVIIRCRAWAQNIIYNKSLKEPSGYSRLQLYLEDSTEEAATEAHT